MKTMTSDSIAVVGGGIAGLATAAALTQAEVPVTVFEQAGALGEVGAGIALMPNALRVIEALGLLSKIDDTSVLDRRGMAIYDAAGRVVSEPQPPRGDGARLIHRADLLSVLRSGIDPGSISLSSRVVAATPGDDHVELQFADGSLERFAGVIGADGIHSVIRPSVIKESAPVFSGMVAYRGLIRAEKLPDWPLDEVNLFAGPGKHFLVFPIRNGTLINFVAFVVADEEMRESWSAPGDPRVLAEEFAGWNDRVTGLIAAVDRTFRWGLYDREPLDSWVNGRIALAGDAAHAMLPHAAQGANQSVEDAGALAVLLRDRPLAEVADAFAEYDTTRRARASFVQRYARRLGLEFDGRLGELRPASELADKAEVMRWIMGHGAEYAAARVREGLPAEAVPIGAPV